MTLNNHWCQLTSVDGRVMWTCRACGEAVDVAETAYQSLTDLAELQTWHKAVAWEAEASAEFRAAAAAYGEALVAWAASDTDYADAQAVREADLRFTTAIATLEGRIGA